MDLAVTRRDVRTLFSGGPNSTKVGVEHELIVADAATGAAVPIERVRAATDHAAYRPHVTFEPGGQVELSLPVASDPMTIARKLTETVAALRDDCATAGIALLDSPVDDRSADVPLQLTSPRYVAMQDRFDTLGPAGRRMMRRTASTQLCLDWWSGSVGLSQWRLLNLAAPSLAAVFARSVGPDSRLATWLAVDPSRTAFDDRLISGSDPVSAYVDFAAGAVPFTAPGDVVQHLTTLFPPVRPRGCYLEVRFLDVQPPERVELIATVLTNLMYDDDCRAHAHELLTAEAGHLADRWVQAAHGTPQMIDLGSKLVDLALSSVRGGIPLAHPEQAA